MPIATFTSDGSDSNASFTSGIDSTYDTYLFIFNNIHPETDNRGLHFMASTDGGSNYGIATTTTSYHASNNESDANAIGYQTGNDHANSTGSIILINEQANDNDMALAGYMYLYNPADTTFVKHFICSGSNGASGGAGVDGARHTFCAGYINTTSAVNAIRFQAQSGEIQGGTIQMFGVH